MKMAVTINKSRGWYLRRLKVEPKFYLTIDCKVRTFLRELYRGTRMKIKSNDKKKYTVSVL